MLAGGSREASKDRCPEERGPWSWGSREEPGMEMEILESSDYSYHLIYNGPVSAQILYKTMPKATCLEACQGTVAGE